MADANEIDVPEEDVQTLGDLKSDLQSRQEACATEIKEVLDKHGFALDASMQQTPTGNAIVASPVLVDVRPKEAE